MVVTVATLTLESEIKLTQAPIHHPMKADGAKQKQLKLGLSLVTNQLSSGQLAAAGSKHVTQSVAGALIPLWILEQDQTQENQINHRILPLFLS